jgi:hypothetical protein
MHYVEILRARRVLTWYTIIVLGVLAITVLSIYAGHADMQSPSSALTVGPILLACAMGAYVVATCIAPGLIAEAATLPITWTRPEPRSRIAWRYIAIDIATIALAYVILIGVVLLFFAIFGALGYLRVVPDDLAMFFLALGSAVMWYGLATLVSSRLPGRGGLIAGMSWVAFVVIGSVWAAPLPGPLHAVLTGLNYLNPMAYIGGVSGGDGQHHAVHPITLDQTWRLVLVWLIAAAALAGTVRLWSTREV